METQHKVKTKKYMEPPLQIGQCFSGQQGPKFYFIFT